MSDTMEVHSPKLYRGQCIHLDKLDFSWFNTLGPGQITWSCFGKSSFWIIRGFTGRWERFWQWHHRLQLIAQGVPYGYSHRKSFFSFWDLEQSKTYNCTKMFSLLQHSFQFSNSKNLQNENAERTAHSSPCFPVNTQWYQGRYWCNREIIKKRCCTVQTHCYSVPRHLSRCHWACHALSHTEWLDPISFVVQTTAGSHINDNPGSYKELCLHIRTSEIKAARRWTPPTAYLDGYYS